LFGIVSGLGLLPMMFGQVKLSPTDEWFALACENIKVNQEELLRRGFHFRINADKVVVHGPFSDTRKGRLDDDYAVDVTAYLSYLNAQLLTKQGRVFVLSDVTIETGHGGVTAKDAPVFSIKMSGADDSRREIEVEKAAMGPAYSVFRVHNASDPIAVRSANIACLAAFIRATIALDEELSSKVPIGSPLPPSDQQKDGKGKKSANGLFGRP
jgi:hypothetical protein